MLWVEVIRALGPTAIDRVALELPDGARVADALRRSGLDAPELAGIAVYGERVALDTLLHDGDRVELLRPLSVDPKQARRRRALAQRGQTGL